MPVFKSGKGLAPGWCELEYFEIVKLPTGATYVFERVGAKEKLVVGTGRCRVTCAGLTVDAEPGAIVDLTEPDGRFEVVEVGSETTLVRMCGRWGDKTGWSGVFTIEPCDDPHDGGDPVDYPKQTKFDNHYHDCDEYWIVIEGRGTVVSEGKSYEVGPGDCLATGMGFHHDFPQAFEPVKGVFFETTLEDQKRLGHLWEHTHGPALPKPNRA